MNDDALNMSSLFNYNLEQLYLRHFILCNNHFANMFKVRGRAGGMSIIR